MSFETVLRTEKPTPLSAARIRRAKQSFVTRRVNLDHIVALDPALRPVAGDVCLARLVRKGHHQRIELPDGRRARMHEGDELILAYGNRYASDQFLGLVPDAPGPCQLAAAGGIAATVVDRHASTKKPTDIEVLGTLCRADGSPLNLAEYAVKRLPHSRPANPHVIAVFGSGMNAGKTTSVCDVVRALAQANLTASVVKITGTGAGGDMWQYSDAGARAALDFTDAGFASTMNLPLERLEQIADHLLDAVSGTSDCIVVEIADGLLQRETAMLLASDWFRQQIDSLILATPDPLSALGGEAHLQRLGYSVASFVGRISTSPLFVSELEAASAIPVLTSEVLIGDERAIGALMQPANPCGVRLVANHA